MINQIRQFVGTGDKEGIADHLNEIVQAVNAENVCVAMGSPLTLNQTQSGKTIDLDINCLKQRLGSQAGLSFGSLTADFTSGASAALTPADVHGTVITGAANVTVYLQASKASYSMVTGTKLSQGTLIPYQMAADKLYYVVGTPRVDIVDVTYSTTDHAFYKTKRDSWGMFYGTTSSNSLIIDLDNCTS